MLVNKEGNSSTKDQDREMHSTISYLQMLIYDLLNSAIKSNQHDEQDDDDFDIGDFAQETQEVKIPKNAEKKTNSQNLETQKVKSIETQPIQIIKAKELNECGNFNQSFDPKSGTPNTASNSSVSGSNKFIGKGKLNPKSQIYKASNSKSAVTNESKVFNNFISPGESVFAQMNMRHNFPRFGISKPMFNPNLEPRDKSDEKLNQANVRFQSDQKDKDQSQNLQKFSSDKKINANDFTLFGEQDSEEFGFGHNLDQTENEEEGKMANYIANSIFEELESP
jgi:hypothetical protein